jgi:dTDP-4-amino-4,6-dideoxygalactose transaminase
MPRAIPFFDYPSIFRDHSHELLTVMTDVMQRGAYILQKDLAEFETNLAAYLKARHVIGVADGTNALKLAFMAAEVGEGDEVIVPSHTYIASAAAVHFVGAKPVLVECGPDHLLEARTIREAITSKTRAVMPVQLNGRTARMDSILELAKQHGLRVIEDAAQALGSRFRDGYAGTFGSAGTFSFHPAKVLGCFGDGGAVVTNDDEIARRVRLLRDHGRDERGDVVAWGTNSRLDNLQAAVLNVKLKVFDAAVAKRRRLAAVYHQALADCAQLVLPPGPDDDADHFDVYQNYEIEAEDRDELKQYLADQGVRTIVQFGGKAVHQHRGLGFDGVRLPFTERLYTRLLLLPMNTALTEDDAHYVAEQVKRFYGRA